MLLQNALFHILIWVDDISESKYSTKSQFLQSLNFRAKIKLSCLHQKGKTHFWNPYQKADPNSINNITCNDMRSSILQRHFVENL